MVFAYLFAQSVSGAAILKDACAKVDSAKTLTYTSVELTEEFKGEHRIRYSFKTGGYFRAETPTVIDVSSPKGGWTYRADKKIYQSRPPIDSSFSVAWLKGFDIFHSSSPVIGVPKEVVWHKMPTLRIELDGRKQMTKETKLFVFVDPKTHNPIGISGNLGSMTQVVIFEDLKVNPPLSDSLFTFMPPKDWKQVTAKSGGWN